MYHVIEILYFPYSIYIPLILFAAGILSAVSVIFAVLAFRKRKAAFIVLAVVFGFIGYQGIPWYYIAKAYTASDWDAAQINFNKAAKTACFSALKGFIYADKASFFFSARDGVSAIKYYNLAHKYLKNYESIWVWAAVPYIYILNEDYDKAIEITTELARHSSGSHSSVSEAAMYAAASKACILKEDYVSALGYINKALDKEPAAPYYLAQRAVIYRNTGKSEDAENDYKKALELCKYSVCTEHVKSSYNNYKFWYKEHHEQERVKYTW